MAERIIPFAVGDVVELKKRHPCGTNAWEVTRIGADIGLKCTGCGRRVMVDRIKLEKTVKRFLKSAADAVD